jgi:hypothetical protein
MRSRPGQKLFRVVLQYPNEMTRTVTVKASSREVAESRALKRNPRAIGVKRDA